MNPEEAKRRINYRANVEAYFRAYPGEWLPASAFLTVGGKMAWRTRIADARKTFEREGGSLENRQQRVNGGVLSEYRYLPQARQGRDSTITEPTAFTDSYKTQEKLW